MPLRAQDSTWPVDQIRPTAHLFINKVLFAHSPEGSIRPALADRGVSKHH